MQRHKRRPSGYDGCEGTSWHIKEILPSVLRNISSSFHEQSQEVLNAWPKVIGEKLAPMTRAISFSQGVLTVRVHNSTLYSVLVQQQKPVLLSRLRETFPSVKVENIIFRMR